MDLKKLLTDFRRRLVTNYHLAPDQTRHIMEFMVWLDGSATARECLAFYGIEWSAEDPTPTVLGFWLIDTYGGDFDKWGKDGDVKSPYPTEEDALAQAAFIQRKGKHRLSLLKLFSNGQMVTIEYNPNERCQECGLLLKTKMVGHPANRSDKTLYEHTYCPQCE